MAEDRNTVSAFTQKTIPGLNFIQIKLQASSGQPDYNEVGMVGNALIFCTLYTRYSTLEREFPASVKLRKLH